MVKEFKPQRVPEDVIEKEARVVATYQQYRYFIGTTDIDGNIISAQRLMKWAKDPKRELICVFCGKEPTNQNGFIYCPLCKTYKGVMPNCPL